MTTATQWDDSVSEIFIAQHHNGDYVKIHHDAARVENEEGHDPIWESFFVVLSFDGHVIQSAAFPDARTAHKAGEVISQLMTQARNSERIVPRRQVLIPPSPDTGRSDWPKAEVLNTKTQQAITAVCGEIEEMLLAKNRSYGDSALDPVRIFSDADVLEQLRVRIDDKISRVKRGQGYPGEDTIDDLIGYLVLYKVAMRNS